MNDGPLASVIVPVYKVEAYLHECVDSILAQSYKRLQIILVDDGSPDRCGEICDEYAAKDTRVEVIHKANGGLGSARNAGLDVARGKYIYFVDSDDYIENNEVEVSIREMEKGNWGLCAWGMVICGENGEFISYEGRAKRSEFFFASEEKKSRFLCRYFLKFRIRCEAWSRVYRRDIIEANHLRFGNERLIGAEDLDFCFRYLLHCENLVCIPEYVYHYRMRSTSIMHTNKWQHWCRQLVNMIWAQRESIGALVPFGKHYLNEAVIIDTFMSQRHNWCIQIEHMAELRQALSETEHWPYIQSEALLGIKDRHGLRKACGYIYGNYLYALLWYLISGDMNEYRRQAERYNQWLKLYSALCAQKNKLVRFLANVREK